MFFKTVFVLDGNDTLGKVVKNALQQKKVMVLYSSCE